MTLGDAPLPPPQYPPDDMPYNPLDPLQSGRVPNIEDMQVGQSLSSPITVAIGDVATETMATGEPPTDVIEGDSDAAVNDLNRMDDQISSPTIVNPQGPNSPTLGVFLPNRQVQ